MSAAGLIGVCLDSIAPAGVCAPAQPWWVVHTRSRQERMVRDDAMARGVECFLPLIETVRYSGRRKVRSSIPLFPGYVFIRGDREAGWELERGERVVRLLAVPDQRVFEAEMGALRLAIEAGECPRPCPYLRAGDWVEVSAGPLRGVRGMVERITQASRLVLRVAMLGRAADLEIDRALLEPVHGP
jgi:transcription antitermination factor NusG